MTVEETLRQLVAIDSVSLRSNAEIISYLAARCEASGFAVKRFPHTDETGTAKINLIALAGAKFNDPPTIELALVGYTDTMPYNPMLTKALLLIKRDGNSFARAASDTTTY